MPIPADYSFARYLQAKKSVDDRALNRLVWQELVSALAHPAAGSPLRILELGAGIGTMIERMLDWGLFARAEYTALDVSADLLAAACRRLEGWAERRGARSAAFPGGLSLRGPDVEVSLRLEPAEALEFAAAQPAFPDWDLLAAHAFLDLIDLPRALPALLGLLKPGGLFYFTINFDGVTLLEPPIDPVFDEQVIALYHCTMDERRTGGLPSGESRTGRRLFTLLPQAGGEILEAGASDWIVYPRRGGYPQDEAYFLHFIVHTLRQALQGRSELDPSRFTAWIAARHAQIERGELVYIAHQMDFLGRRA